MNIRNIMKLKDGFKYVNKYSRNGAIPEALVPVNALAVLS